MINVGAGNALAELGALESQLAIVKEIEETAGAQSKVSGILTKNEIGIEEMSTLMICAVELEKDTVVKALINAGIDVNMKTAKGSFLHIAVATGNTTICRMLIAGQAKLILETAVDRGW